MNEQRKPEPEKESSLPQQSETPAPLSASKPPAALSMEKAAPLRQTELAPRPASSQQEIEQAQEPPMNKPGKAERILRGVAAFFVFWIVFMAISFLIPQAITLMDDSDKAAKLIILLSPVLQAVAYLSAYLTALSVSKRLVDGVILGNCIFVAVVCLIALPFMKYIYYAPGGSFFTQAYIVTCISITVLLIMVIVRIRKSTASHASES